MGIPGYNPSSTCFFPPLLLTFTYKEVMFYLIYALIFALILVENAALIEDLQLLFDKKNCIEASSVSLSQVQDASVMFDRTTTVNVSEITKTIFDKSVISRINELAQFNDISYTLELISEEGPPHNRLYKIVLKLGDERYEGSGSSLKKAQQAAATLAIENTYYEHPPIEIKSEKEQSLTPTVVLNNIAMKLGIGISYFLVTDKEEQAIASYGSSNEAYGKSKNYYQQLNQSNSFRIPTEEPQISGPFTVRVKVGDSQFVGFGHTIQAARHDAATQAIKAMEKQSLYKDSICSTEDSVTECKQRKESLKSPISRIYEAAQKRNLPVECNVISESGKSHQKLFVTQCKLGDFVSEGEGKSKKESKKNAAENMLPNLSQLPEILDEKEIINALSSKKKKKKKKNKILKNNKNIIQEGISSILNSFWNEENESPTKNTKNPTDDDKTGIEHKQKPGTASAKGKLLEIGNMLNIGIEFTDLNKYGDDFYTLVSLRMHPEYICLGKALNREESHHTAALNGLKFLHKFGILNKAGLTQIKEKSVYLGDLCLEKADIIDGSVEDLDKVD